MLLTSKLVLHALSYEQPTLEELSPLLDAATTLSGWVRREGRGSMNSAIKPV